MGVRDLLGGQYCFTFHVSNSFVLYLFLLTFLLALLPLLLLFLISASSKLFISQPVIFTFGPPKEGGQEEMGIEQGCLVEGD